MKRLLQSLVLLALLLGSVFFAQRYFNQPDIPQLYTIPEFEFPSQKGTIFSNQNFYKLLKLICKNDFWWS